MAHHKYTLVQWNNELQQKSHNIIQDNTHGQKKLLEL